MVSCQASPGVGGLPLLGEEGHGLVRGTEPLARHFLMQRHPHVVPCRDDEFLLLVMSGPALLIVMLQVLDFPLLLCQLVFQRLDVRSRSHRLLHWIQGFDHLPTQKTFLKRALR